MPFILVQMLIMAGIENKQCKINTFAFKLTIILSNACKPPPNIILEMLIPFAFQNGRCCVVGSFEWP